MGAWPEGVVMLMSVGRDNVKPAPVWRVHGTESRCHLPAGLFLFIFFFLLPTCCFMFYIYRIYFQGRSQKRVQMKIFKTPPMLPASMIVAKNKNNLCDCCKINKAGSPHIASMHAQYTNSKLTYSYRSIQPPL